MIDFIVWTIYVITGMFNFPTKQNNNHLLSHIIWACRLKSFSQFVAVHVFLSVYFTAIFVVLTFALVYILGQKKCRREFKELFILSSSKPLIMNDMQFKGQIQKKLYREQTQLSHLQVRINDRWSCSIRPLSTFSLIRDNWFNSRVP